MQFCVAVDEFLRFCRLERQLSVHTVQAYAADLGDFRKWLKADVAIGDVSPATLKNYLEEMVGERKLTVATVRRRFACLRAFFRRATQREQCPDPFANWHPLLPRRKRLPRALSRGEAAFLVASGSTAWDGWARATRSLRSLSGSWLPPACGSANSAKSAWTMCRPIARLCAFTAKARASVLLTLPTRVSARVYKRSFNNVARRGQRPGRCSSIAMARQCGRNRCVRSCAGLLKRLASTAASRRICCGTRRRPC